MEEERNAYKKYEESYEVLKNTEEQLWNRYERQKSVDGETTLSGCLLVDLALHGHDVKF